MTKQLPSASYCTINALIVLLCDNLLFVYIYSMIYGKITSNYYLKSIVSSPSPQGCYLGRVTYIRRGEPGIGSSYKPVFEVVYYRGIRFHVSSNQISMFTAPSDPSSIVAVLSKSHQLASLSTDVSLFENSNNDSQAVIKTAASGTLLEGTYEWYDHDSIICTLHQLTDKENQPPIRKHRRLGSIIPELTVTFTIKFKIRNKNGRLHNQLIWDSYVIHTFDKSSKNESTTVLELTKQHFPPCRFVRVRNFISDAATSLL
ncbi:F-box only protein 9 [Schistosoma japonicum]|nr:F-box only protein 9 [Schistosoma japonicum]